MQCVFFGCLYIMSRFGVTEMEGKRYTKKSEPSDDKKTSSVSQQQAPYAVGVGVGVPLGPPYLNRFELARILTLREASIAHNGKTLVRPGATNNQTKPKAIVDMEMRDPRLIPLLVGRKISGRRPRHGQVDDSSVQFIPVERFVIEPVHPVLFPDSMLRGTA